MSDAITPALTAEEWEQKWFPPQTARYSTPASVNARGELWIQDYAVYGEGPSFRLRVDRRHALAALALHGQPFGFRPEMVAALSRTCDNAERWIADRMLDPADDTALDLAREATALIRALLPPA